MFVMLCLSISLMTGKGGFPLSKELSNIKSLCQKFHGIHHMLVDLFGISVSKVFVDQFKI